MEISNKLLALLVVVAMGLSAVSTFTLLSRLSIIQAQEPFTGKATSQQGTVNFTVQSSVSIVLTNSIVDFGSGFVNTSKCGTNATLFAGATYNDTENNDCWVDTVNAAPVSFNIQNDGNRNVQLQVIGPDQRAFLNYSGSYPNNLTWRARNNESTSCVGGATFQTAYTDFGGALKTVCSNMTFQPNNQDEIAVDIQIVIPADITPGKRENSTVDFQASAAS